MLTHGVALSKVNPRLARRFAEATGSLIKTDQADAEMLARYGLLLTPRLLRKETVELNDLKELHAARLALIKDRTATKNRQKNLTLPLLKRHNAVRLKQIEAQLTQVDQAITAFALLIEMPELGELEDKAAAALSGLAPRNRQSGGWTGRACIAGGRAIVRRALYMPAIVAIRFNPDLKAKYESLIKAGKPPKVAITAVMRKLVVLTNTLLRQNRKWKPKPA